MPRARDCALRGRVCAGARGGGGGGGAALEAVKRESAVSADLADLRDRVGETEEARERMAAAAAAEAAERAAREDELRRAESRGADLLVELQHEKLRSEQAGKRLAGAERKVDDQQAALAKMETRLHKAVGSLAAKAIWRWQNAVILRCWHAWRERTRGRAALNGLLELQPPVLDAAVPAANEAARQGLLRRRSVTKPAARRQARRGGVPDLAFRATQLRNSSNASPLDSHHEHRISRRWPLAEPSRCMCSEKALALCMRVVVLR